ncbi:hypothetical protein JYU22_03555 [Gammaproteobacteria bacterium AH-315-E17]|nr:hypothetical protein [Gammaproteobacteria bacterium AH-315-E17]
MKIGTAGMLCGLTNLSGSALALTLNKKQRIPLQGIFDSNYEESRIFSETLASQGIALLDIKESLGAIWYSKLRSSLMEQPRALFGLTNRLSLFCLEELARDLNMKVHTRIDHLIDQQGRVEHLPVGSAVLSEATKLLGNSAGFGRTIAEATDLASKTSISSKQSETSVQKITGPYAPLNKTALVTWVIS